MDEDVAMALLDGGVLAADARVGDANVVLVIAADGRELLRQREARGLLAGGCREREVESGALCARVPAGGCRACSTL